MRRYVLFFLIIFLRIIYLPVFFLKITYAVDNQKHKLPACRVVIVFDDIMEFYSISSLNMRYMNAVMGDEVKCGKLIKHSVFRTSPF